MINKEKTVTMKIFSIVFDFDGRVGNRYNNKKYVILFHTQDDVKP